MRNRETAFTRNRATASPVPLRLVEGDGALPTGPHTTGLSIARLGEVWLQDGRAQGWSPATVNDRRLALKRFCWWLEHEACLPSILDNVTTQVVREFLIYAREPSPNGRYGSSNSCAHRPARPATVNAYYRILRAFLNFCIEEGHLQDSPLQHVKAPRVPVDQVQPFSQEQVEALLNAANRSRNGERDATVILVLLDTGLRVSELCTLRIGDIEYGDGELRVTGKGDKQRTVYLGRATRRALWNYIERCRTGAHADEPLFLSTGGTQSGTALTPSGVRRAVAYAGERARIAGVRCSPHTLRHTFAVSFIRNGGNLFQLQQLMGHTDLTVLRKYVLLAEADLAEAHHKSSPVDGMRIR